MEEKILVTKSTMPTYEEYIEAIKPLWDSHWLTNMGTYHKQLEEKLKEYLGVPELSLMVNGHMALELAIQAIFSFSSISLAGRSFCVLIGILFSSGYLCLFLVRDIIGAQEFLFCQNGDLQFLGFLILGRSRGDIVVDETGGLAGDTSGHLTALFLDDFL